jgi:hypothetical protein
VNGDGFTGAPAREAGQDVGTYAIGQGTVSAGTNYALAFSAGTLTITRKPVSVASVAVADKVYDGTTAATITTRALGAADRVGGDDVVLTGGAAVFDTKDVGTDKPVAVTGLALGGAKAGNYALQGTTFAAKASITARPIAVVADALTKTYGDADPALTYRLSSGTLVNDESLTGALARVAGNTVGSYAISQGTLAAGTNYALTFTGASLTITKRAASVTSAVATKVYGAPDPALTGTLAGFVPGDNVTATFTACGRRDGGGRSLRDRRGARPRGRAGELRRHQDHGGVHHHARAARGRGRREDQDPGRRAAGVHRHRHRPAARRRDHRGVRDAGDRHEPAGDVPDHGDARARRPALELHAGQPGRDAYGDPQRAAGVVGGDCLGRPDPARHEQLGHG